MPRNRTQNNLPHPGPLPKERGKKPEVVIVSDLSAVEAAHRQSFTVSLDMFGRVFQFEGRHLLPRESNRVMQLLDAALPPLLPPAEEGGEPRYNFEDADYKARHETARRQSRALALWLGYPCFKVEAVRLLADKSEIGKAESRNPAKLPDTVEEIAGFIESRAMDDDALQLLFRALTASAVKLEAFVNFTSGSSSPKS